MKRPATRFSLVHVVLIVIGFVLIGGLFARYVHRRKLHETSLADSASVAVPPEASVVAVKPKRAGTSQILAACAPQRRDELTSVPNFEVSDRYNTSAITLKVRFLVNGDGFVTRSFVAGSTVASAADQQAELDFVQHLTFTVPDSEECRARPLEMVANFSESREAAGEWATVIEVHPLYSFDGDRVVQRP